jgi:hypothetical protein
MNASSPATTPNQPDLLPPLSQALAVAASEPCVQLDPLLAPLCTPLQVRPTSVPSIADPFFALYHSTWRPKGSFFFTLIKTPRDTLLHCHENGTTYVAAPCLKLAGECPPYTAFLAQWCLDRGGPTDAPTPHLLVFDLLTRDPSSPAARGEWLRALARFLPQPLCVVQWSGHAAALDRFAGTLPHEVDYFLHLTENPLRPERHLQIVVPPRGDP